MRQKFMNADYVAKHMSAKTMRTIAARLQHPQFGSARNALKLSCCALTRKSVVMTDLLYAFSRWYLRKKYILEQDWRQTQRHFREAVRSIKFWR